MSEGMAIPRGEPVEIYETSADTIRSDALEWLGECGRETQTGFEAGLTVDWYEGDLEPGDVRWVPVTPGDVLVRGTVGVYVWSSDRFDREFNRLDPLVPEDGNEALGSSLPAETTCSVCTAQFPTQLHDRCPACRP